MAIGPPAARRSLGWNLPERVVISQRLYDPWQPPMTMRTLPERALLLDNRILEQQKPGEILRKAFVVDDKSTAQQKVVRLGARKGAVYEVLDGLQQRAGQ